MTGTVSREDRDEPGLIEQTLLEVREEERAIARQRTTEAAAVLLLVHRQRGAGERIRRVETVVTDEIVERAPKRVRATLRHDVDVAAERAAELGLASRGHDLELLNGIHAVRDPAQPRRIVIRREPIDDEVVRQVSLAGDGDALARHRRRLGEQLRAADVRRRHSRNQERQIQEVAAVHRQALDFCLWHGARDLASCRFEEGSVACDGDARVQSRQREHHRDVEGGTDRGLEDSGAVGESVQRESSASYVPTLRYGKRNRPSEFVTVSAVTFVSVCRALTWAPGTTAPCGSVTRPLTLAKLIASCARASRNRRHGAAGRDDQTAIQPRFHGLPPAPAGLETRRNAWTRQPASAGLKTRRYN